MVSLPAASIIHSHVPDCVQPGVRDASAGTAAAGSAAGATGAAGAEGSDAEGAASASTRSDAEGAARVAEESTATPGAADAVNGSEAMGGGQRGCRLIDSVTRCEGRHGRKSQRQHDRKEDVRGLSIGGSSCFHCLSTSFCKRCQYHCLQYTEVRSVFRAQKKDWDTCPIYATILRHKVTLLLTNYPTFCQQTRKDSSIFR